MMIGRAVTLLGPRASGLAPYVGAVAAAALLVPRIRAGLLAAARRGLHRLLLLRHSPRLPSSLVRTSLKPRLVHYSYRQTEAPPRVARRADRLDVASVEVVTEHTGTTTYACELAAQHPRSKIGTMVAANSGRPGGACGLRGHVQKIHPGHRTQEEDLFSNWMITASPTDETVWNHLYRATIDVGWGMVEPGSADTRTIQGVDDYTTTESARAYADAWTVDDCVLSAKRHVSEKRSEYCSRRRYATTLVFAAGPNANDRALEREPASSMRRTYNARAKGSYDHFRECVRWTMRAALDGMIDSRCDIALLAMTSCGLYAGPHRRRISGEFVALVNELLAEPIGPSDEPRGAYFERVVLVKL